MSSGMMHKDVFRGIAEELIRVEERLRAMLSADELPLGEALCSTLQGPGKLLRPGLLLLIAKNGRGADADRGVTLGCAVEMLHIATLLHDDVIDGSGTRRRRPTAARILGDRGSILLGDHLFAKCLRMLAEGGEFAPLGLLARTVEVCAEGELSEQANLFNLSLTIEQYTNINNKKTAGLFAASCRLGSELHGHSNADSDALSEFGRQFGHGFQIIDDLLDFVGDARSMGKPTAQDLAHGVITLPTILALRASGASSRYGGGAVCEPPLQGEPESVKAATVRFGPERVAQIRRLVLEGGALEATIDAAGDCFLEAQRRLVELDRNDGLADKLVALCDMTLSMGEDALLSFRANANKARTNSKGSHDDQ